ncbi:MAG: lysostaphin resistance A-like protein [Promethearchaeota archaeon]
MSAENFKSEKDEEEKEAFSKTSKSEIDEEEKQKRLKILRYCPNCGGSIEWTKDYRYCIHCRNYLIPYIPQDKISFWLGLDRQLSEEEIFNLYNVPYYPTENFRKSSKKSKLWDWKGALGYPILAYGIKFLILLIPTIILIFLNLDRIDLNTLDIPEDLMSTLTFIDISTQFIFILVPLYFMKFYLPKNATIKEKLNLMGFPIGNLDKKQYSKEILLGILFAIIMTIGVVAVQYASAYFVSFIYKRPVNDFLEFSGNEDLTSMLPITPISLVFIIIIMFVSVAPSEEILFRGVSQQGFVRSFGTSAGILITALYFSLFHIYLYILLDPAYFLFLFFPYFLISTLLGVLYNWRKNLIACIIAHALYNSIQFLLVYFLA